MPTLYTPDQVDGTALDWKVYPAAASAGGAAAAVAIGGLQTINFRHSYPARVVTEAGRAQKKRFQATDTDSVNWSTAALTLYKQTFADVMGLTSNPAIDYGSLQWNKFIFDFSIDLAETDDQGNVIQIGGWLIHNARLIDFEYSLGDPFAIVMQGVNGVAFSSVPKPWG